MKKEDFYWKLSDDYNEHGNVNIIDDNGKGFIYDLLYTSLNDDGRKKIDAITDQKKAA